MKNPARVVVGAKALVVDGLGGFSLDANSGDIRVMGIADRRIEKGVSVG